MNIDDNADHRWANTLLDRAVGTEPELGFRAEDVLARARRQVARRRAALTGALTATAVLGTGLLVGHGGSPPSGVEAGNGGSTVPSPVAPSSAAPTTVYGVEGPLVLDAHGRALTAKLADAHLIPPGVKESTDKYYGGEPLVFYKLINGQNVNSYVAQATLTDSHGAGHLVVQLLKYQRGINCVAVENPQACRVQTLPDGSRITVLRYTPEPSPGEPTIQWIVELVRPDGTAVDAMSGNWSMDGDKNTGGIDHATGAEPPLNDDALVRLVQLPGLTL
ncbi:hypothetical protein [Amycolatopsis taiwanensis]|uniref:Uncharacterized protein n=1 Tax=Amycolatopsis taiwanensis TaxID=342230 RepID=A0A9W6R7X3_9PSEU|nr:hypothetical protein [Amycolatopsis taiwanensis]GLY70771.1 hypothetical protein Atai01_73900 [Amycolatopsis taiwanensis]